METKDMLNPKSIFEFKGRRYKFHSNCYEPSFTMVDIDSGEAFPFGVNSPNRYKIKLVGHDKAKESGS
ncbi:MAG: hypothetical protein KJ804_12275 [Proteobacteria bacterium]|nr:hypothetical protein [Pseudomonadota bacterium]